MFISFEGMNGSGKSTQARLCADWLREEGCDVTLTREPGGTPGAEEIRGLILQGDADRWSRETEILLFHAARRDHVEKLIQPDLDAGIFVVTDRYIDSTIVLQTLDDQSGEVRRKIDLLHQEMIGLDPDLTILIDISLETVQKRMAVRTGDDPDRMEQVSGMQQHEYKAYQKLAAEFPDRIIKVSGEGSVVQVATRVRDVIRPYLDA
jgi:dTMP kinase